MAKDELRNPPEEDGKINPSDYGMTGQLAKMVRAAMRDPDPVSMMVMGSRPDTVHVAIVVLKGKDVLAFFEAWAKRNKIMSEHSAGMSEAIDGQR